MATRKVIDIAVRERFLWVDAEAYPLANIARVSSFRTKVNLWRALGRFVVRAVVIAAVLVAAVWYAQGETVAMAAGPVGVGVLISFVIFIVEVAKRPLHALGVETTGPPYALVLTPDRAKILDLVQRITHAINNPQAEFSVTIENFQVGDSITQIGDRNTVNKR
ncbi:DUF6232 family protein [Actinokineospora soli]|uniref:DUF6232 family protein n=1 Tax=Actinokineospora soli TaxID=1048753 RepID=A0ABW2TGR2_9PSEU